MRHAQNLPLSSLSLSLCVCVSPLPEQMSNLSPLKNMEKAWRGISDRMVMWSLEFRFVSHFTQIRLTAALLAVTSDHRRQHQPFQVRAVQRTLVSVTLVGIG